MLFWLWGERGPGKMWPWENFGSEILTEPKRHLFCYQDGVVAWERCFVMGSDTFQVPVPI